MRALVIDDSATMRHIVADILGGLGIESWQAANGPEALDLLESGETFELACIDWNMGLVIAGSETSAGVALVSACASRSGVVAWT
jgi:two-component system chemotaxis response regulator CheY